MKTPGATSIGGHCFVCASNAPRSNGRGIAPPLEGGVGQDHPGGSCAPGSDVHVGSEDGRTNGGGAFCARAAFDVKTEATTRNRPTTNAEIFPARRATMIDETTEKKTAFSTRKDRWESQQDRRAVLGGERVFARHPRTCATL